MPRDHASRVLFTWHGALHEQVGNRRPSHGPRTGMLPGGAAASGPELKTIDTESVAQGGAVRPDHGEPDPVLSFRELDAACHFDRPRGKDGGRIGVESRPRGLAVNLHADGVEVRTQRQGVGAGSHIRTFSAASTRAG